MLAIIFSNTSPKFLNIEQRLVQKLLYFNISMYIKELMFLGFEYSFLYPLILTLESTKGYFFTSPLLRVNELLRLNFNIKEFNILPFTCTHNHINSYFSFLNLMCSFNNVNAFSSSLHIMSNTGAKATWNQICQLIGVRGYLANATGEFFKIPVLNSFTRGLNLFEYFISCYGARKGILDTALKTADAGYLTRRLVESIQELSIKEYSCGSTNSFEYTTQINSNGGVVLPFFLFLSGKVLQKNLVDINTRKILEFQFNYLSDKLIHILYCNRFNFLLKINTFSVKTCLSARTICSMCFGYTTFKTNSLGRSAGILAAQVIGEPGTQLTLRTFHTGGVSAFSLINPSKKNNLPFNYKYLHLFKVKKYKLCSTFPNIWGKNKTKISPFIFLKRYYYFTAKSPHIWYVLKKNKINQNLSLNSRLVYIKNNVLLNVILLSHLNINKIFQRRFSFNCIYKHHNYVAESLYKYIVQLIIKNKCHKWTSINLTKSTLFNTIFSAYHILDKEKIIFINSKNQRFSRLFIIRYKNFLHSYIGLRNLLSSLKYVNILNILFSNNYYLYTQQDISQSTIYKYRSLIKLFGLSQRKIKYKSFLK